MLCAPRTSHAHAGAEPSMRRATQGHHDHASRSRTGPKSHCTGPHRDATPCKGRGRGWAKCRAPGGATSRSSQQGRAGDAPRWDATLGDEAPCAEAGTGERGAGAETARRPGVCAGGWANRDRATGARRGCHGRARAGRALQRTGREAALCHGQGAAPRREQRARRWREETTCAGAEPG
jgi:hypothetical protein